MTKEEALERNAELIAKHKENQHEVRLLLDRIAALYPGMTLSLVVRDAAVPPLVVSAVITSKDNPALLAFAVAQIAAKHGYPVSVEGVAPSTYPAPDLGRGFAV